MVSIEDKNLACKDCGITFIWTAAEQEFFQQRQLTNCPKRCHDCRLALRKRRHPDKVNHLSRVPCAHCETMTTVPFQPRGNKPILCLACMHEARKKTAAESCIEAAFASFRHAAMDEVGALG